MKERPTLKEMLIAMGIILGAVGMWLVLAIGLAMALQRIGS